MMWNQINKGLLIYMYACAFKIIQGKWPQGGCIYIHLEWPNLVLAHFLPSIFRDLQNSIGIYIQYISCQQNSKTFLSERYLLSRKLTFTWLLTFEYKTQEHTVALHTALWVKGRRRALLILILLSILCYKTFMPSFHHAESVYLLHLVFVLILCTSIINEVNVGIVLFYP